MPDSLGWVPGLSRGFTRVHHVSVYAYSIKLGQALSPEPFELEGCAKVKLSSI